MLAMKSPLYCSEIVIWYLKNLHLWTKYEIKSRIRDFLVFNTSSKKLDFKLKTENHKYEISCQFHQHLTSSCFIQNFYASFSVSSDCA